MIEIRFWEEPLAAEILTPPVHPLYRETIDTLWLLFAAIGQHWRLPTDVELLRSRWMDMLEARSSGSPDYRGEYLNAARVYAEMTAKLTAPLAISQIYKDTIITDESLATTRLLHAKVYVANDFIRCFVANGGYRGFVPKGRNYAGFMGGSRLREWPPVRTGKRV